MKINKITSKINVLTCASVVGLISSVVLSGYDTIKARKKIDEIHNFEELSIMKKVEVVVPCYMETIAAASATTLCIIGMSNISKKNINKLSAAYASLYTNYQSYVNSVREIHNGDEDVVLNMSKKEPEYGVYHSTNEGFTTWCDFTKKIFEIAGISTKVRGITSKEYKEMYPQSSDRPTNSQLSKEKLKSVGIYPENYEVALEKYLKEELKNS